METAYQAVNREPASTRKSQVSSSMDELSEVVENLHGAITNLGERLTPILRSEPQKLSEEANKIPATVPLAGALNDRVKRIRDAIYRLDVMTGCVEL